MYIGSGRRRPLGTADADNPSFATLERRRQSDLGFLFQIRCCSYEELLALRARSKGWRVVAVDRQLRLRFQEGRGIASDAGTDESDP